MEIYAIIKNNPLRLGHIAGQMITLNVLVQKYHFASFLMDQTVQLKMELFVLLLTIKIVYKIKASCVVIH
jgi:hypothetical protein